MNKIWKAIKSSLDLTREDNFYRWLVLIFGGASGINASRGWWIWTGIFVGLMLVSLAEYHVTIKKQADEAKTIINFNGSIPSSETIAEVIKKAHSQGGI